MNSSNKIEHILIQLGFLFISHGECDIVNSPKNSALSHPLLVGFVTAQSLQCCAVSPQSFQLPLNLPDTGGIFYASHLKSIKKKE